MHKLYEVKRTVSKTRFDTTAHSQLVYRSRPSANLCRSVDRKGYFSNASIRLFWRWLTSMKRRYPMLTDTFATLQFTIPSKLANTEDGFQKSLNITAILFVDQPLSTMFNAEALRPNYRWYTSISILIWCWSVTGDSVQELFARYPSKFWQDEVALATHGQSRSVVEKNNKLFSQIMSTVTFYLVQCIALCVGACACMCESRT